MLYRIFGDPTSALLKKMQKDVDAINAHEETCRAQSNEELRARVTLFRERLTRGETLDTIQHEAFATVREMSFRILKQRHYDVQLIGGIVLHGGSIAEMRTGEGKTLTSTLAAYTNALTQGGVHIVTPNDYLARRDAVWMGQLFDALGLTVGCIQAQNESFVYDSTYSGVVESAESVLVEGADTPKTTASFKVHMEFLRPCTRKEAYASDITYGTNNEFGFDYLRDNMAVNSHDRVQRELTYAIVDEIDSILIDEARTPLIISAPAQEATDQYYHFAGLVAGLSEHVHFTIDEKERSAILTSDGIAFMEQALGVANLYTEGGMKMVHHIENALRAHAIYKKDKDYVVIENEIIIVDEFTGRLMHGRRYSEGLHQAIEAKENVPIQRESETLATITFQNYFRMYTKLSGMTGTAETEAEEFSKIYGLDVVSIPTNQPVIRKDLGDKIYSSEKGKFDAVIVDITERIARGQPILVGTASIEKNELFSHMLDDAGISHELLNAKNHEREAQIIAQAGKPGAVTVATNMAGRGVDIVLGGNPPDSDDARRARSAGGLCVLATERHESRRIDNQLRGRSGRQGDPGVSQFYISVEDDLMRIFGSDRLKSIMTTLKFPEDMPIENVIVSKSLETAQKKVESHNFDVRKHLLEYDDVLNRHRTAIYKKRQEILKLGDSNSAEDWIVLRSLAMRTVHDQFVRILELCSSNNDSDEQFITHIEKIFALSPDERAKIALCLNETTQQNEDASESSRLMSALMDIAHNTYALQSAYISDERILAQIEKNIMLRGIDSVWVEHLVAIQYLRNSIGLQGYGQRDPLIEYKKIAFTMYQELVAAIDEEIVMMLFRIHEMSVQAESLMERAGVTLVGAPKIMEGENNELGKKTDTEGNEISKIGRNSPCMCGSGKKYKKCHGM